MMAEYALDFESSANPSRSSAKVLETDETAFESF